MHSTDKQFTPFGVFGIALLIITIATFAMVYLDWVNHRDAKMVKYMQDHQDEVNQWLQDKEGR